MIHIGPVSLAEPTQQRDPSRTAIGPQPHPSFVEVFGQASFGGGEGEVAGAGEDEEDVSSCHSRTLGRYRRAAGNHIAAYGGVQGSSMPGMSLAPGSSAGPLRNSVTNRIGRNG